jgi:hypothetical protein
MKMFKTEKQKGNFFSIQSEAHLERDEDEWVPRKSALRTSADLCVSAVNKGSVLKGKRGPKTGHAASFSPPAST